MLGVEGGLVSAFWWLHMNARTYVGQSAIAYGWLQAALRSPRSRGLVRPSTELCIEAPSGSGSSFFVTGFLMANPAVSVAHHHHVAAQVKRSARFGVPALVLLRNPLDCVVSRASHRPVMVGAVFRQWIRFFRAVEAFPDAVLLASFEAATAGPETVVQSLNARFDTSFDSRFPASERVFSAMDRSWGDQRGAFGHEPRNPNRPSEEKESLKRGMRARVEAHPLAPTAEALYESLSRNAL